MLTVALLTLDRGLFLYLFTKIMPTFSAQNKSAKVVKIIIIPKKKDYWFPNSLFMMMKHKLRLLKYIQTALN